MTPTRSSSASVKPHSSTCSNVQGSLILKTGKVVSYSDEKSYGFSVPEEPVEVVNIRIACIGLLPKPVLKPESAAGKNVEIERKDTRKVYLKGGMYRTAVYDRSLLQPGAVIPGPAIIEQKDSTTLLFPGNTGTIDEYRNIIIDIAGGT